MNTCPPCGRPVADGYLCHACSDTLRDTIRQVPEWADQVTMVLARLTRYTDPAGGRRKGPVALPYNPAASDPARRLDAAVRACAAMLGAKNIEHVRLGLVCAWLAYEVPVLRALPDAPYWERRISHAVEAAIKVSDRPAEQWYAGACEGCGKDLYPSATDRVVKCPCGKAWGVQERRDGLLAQARDVVAPAPVIARALAPLGTTPVSMEQLRKWRHQGRLHPKGMTSGKHPANKYRVGDVLDLLLAGDRRRRK